MKIVFFGPPGSGKGTQAKLIAKELNIPHLSSGDILREKLHERNNLSLQLKETISSGKLVSDKILNQIITNKLMSKDCYNGFILDGYPRTISQSEFLLSLMKINNINLDLIFDFNIDFSIVEKRIILRSQKEQRSDDNLDVIKTRLEKYSTQTYPVLKYFSVNFNKKYFVIDASQEVSQIQKELLKIIKKAEN